MNELDDIWSAMLDNAINSARSSGRGEIARYLELKASNDTIRSAGCQWLFDSFFELSEAANKLGIRLDIENEEPHRFEAGASTMVGWQVQFKLGLRALTVEAGWPRTPKDGFVRGGGLAIGRISHFGISKANQDIILKHSTDKIPEWFTTGDEKINTQISLASLDKHFQLFLDLDR